jgi:hypothetical protein
MTLTFFNTHNWLRSVDTQNQGLQIFKNKQSSLSNKDLEVKKWF